MPDSADPVAAALGQIGERNGQLRTKYGYVGGLLVLTKAQYDVPRLLAAVEAVLELAAGARAVLSIPPADCTYACDSADCDCSGKSRIAGWDLDPAKLRDAISRALLGEEPADGA